MRCVNCQRRTRDPYGNGFTYWSDGLGELHPLCAVCSVREFSPGATTGRDVLSQGRELLMTTKATLLLPGDGDVREVPVHQGYAQMKYMRTRSLFDSVTLLLGNELASEAMMLTRSLFESSLQLMELASRDDWPRVVIGWYMKEVDHMRYASAEALRIGEQTAAETEADVARYQRTRDALLAHAERNGFGVPVNFHRTKLLANRHGRNDDFLNYLMAHSAVHGSAAALLFRAKRVEDTVRMHQRGGEPWLPLGCVAFAVRSYVYAHRAACRLFDWAEPAGIDDLLATSHALDDAAKAVWGDAKAKA